MQSTFVELTLTDNSTIRISPIHIVAVYARAENETLLVATPGTEYVVKETPKQVEAAVGEALNH